MKTKNLIHLLLALGATYLLHSETPGLNLFLLSFLTVLSFGILNPSKLKSGNWWLASTLLLVNGFSVFYLGKTYHTILFLIALTYFVAVSHSSIQTFYFLIYDTLRNTIVNLTQLFSYGLDLLFGDASKEITQKTKWLKKSLIFFVPALLFTLFLQLYRLSSSNFEELSGFISFNWISPSWIALFLVMYLLIYTWVVFQPDHILARLEHKLSKRIVLGRADKITHFLTRELEVKIAIAIVATLSLLLVFLIISDILLFSRADLYQNGLEFISQELHNGVYALIASIVITVGLVSFILRGNLNFFQPVLVNLTVVWLALNIVVVSTNFAKNWIYVDLGGLTYKRIGVFIYLSLTFIGLLYTLFKVTMKERFFYILKTTGMSFFVVITAAFTINWDVVITHYNLSEKFNPEEIDYPYLISLKEGNQHLLIEYAQAGKIPNRYWHIIKEPTEYGKSKEPTSWKSMVYTQYQKEQALRQFYAQQNNSSPGFPETE